MPRLIFQLLKFVPQLHLMCPMHVDKFFCTRTLMKLSIWHNLQGLRLLKKLGFAGLIKLSMVLNMHLDSGLTSLKLPFYSLGLVQARLIILYLSINIIIKLYTYRYMLMTLLLQTHLCLLLNKYPLAWILPSVLNNWAN